MDGNAFAQYLKDRYEDQISWYQRKAASSKRWYQIIQWSVIILAAIVPVLVTAAPSSLEDKYSYIWWITVIASVLLAIGTAGVKTFKFQENWITYRATSERLMQEKFFYDGGVGEYGETSDRESLFVKRVEALISGESDQWVSTQNNQV